MNGAVRDKQRRRLDREPSYPAFRRVNPLKQIVERKSPLRWYDKFTVENIISLGKSNGGGSDFRKVPTKILPRLGPHCRRILIAAQKATEAIPFWFILPMAAAGNFADCPSFHRLRKRYRPARQLSGQGLLKSSAYAAGRMRARPVSSSLTLRRCAGLSVMMTSRVGRTWPSPRWPALALPCRVPSTMWI